VLEKAKMRMVADEGRSTLMENKGLIRVHQAFIGG
jgi:hypothetical protein